MTYKFIVDFDTSQDEPDTNRTEKAEPFLLVCLVDMNADVACPVYSSGLGVSNVSDIVDMPCLRSDLGVHWKAFLGEHTLSQTCQHLLQM